jgi:uncharacterized protein involved in type VI secretion and phage assembly
VTAMNLSPDITVSGTALAAKWLELLTQLKIDRQLGLVGRCTLRFADTGVALATANLFSLGQEIVVGQVDGPKVFTGTVTGVSLDQGTDRQPELLVVADDAAYKLALSTRTKAYLNMTYSDVLGDIAGAASLSVSSKAPETALNEYLLQSGTDLDFLNEIAARTGRVWWVEGASTVRFEKAGAADATVSVKLGEDLEEFSVRASGLKPNAVEVVGWDIDQQQVLSGRADTTTSEESDLVAGYPGRKSGSNTVVVRDANPLTAAEAQAMATSLFAQTRSESVVARGTCDFNGAIAPAVTVSVQDAGPATGSYQVTAVEHRYDRRGFVTRFTAGPLRPAGLVDVLTPAPEGGFAIDGVVTAVVTNVADPKNLGRVKLKYTTQGDTVESPWARIATIGGGKGRGFEFQPEVNDEVLVAFEFGDSRRPVVLGGLFSSANTLPTSAKPGNVDGSTIAYRRLTSRLGHVVELADGTDDATKYVMLQLAGKKDRIRIGADSAEITTQSTKVTVTNGKATVTLTDAGDITLDGVNVKVTASGNYSVEAKGQVSIKGATVAVEGQGDLQMKSSGMAAVQASGPLTLKGAMVAIN